MNRRINIFFLSTLLLALIILTSYFAAFKKTKWNFNVSVNARYSDYNIILVSIDTLRADHLPCYGYKRNTAPNICSLAKHGFIFENFISQAYLTPVSMMSMFTSQYPTTTGFNDFVSVLPKKILTLPEILQKSGVNTVAFGSTPELMYSLSQHKMLKYNKKSDQAVSFSRGFNEFYYTGFRNIPRDSLAWIKRNHSKKFFLWLTMGTVHWPYALRGNIEDKAKYDPANYNGMFRNYHSIPNKVNLATYEGEYYTAEKKSEKLSEDDHKYIISKYDFRIDYSDQFIGSLIETLAAEDLLKKTIIIIHGIHGEDLGEHGYYTHYDIFDTEVKTALIVYLPNKTNKAKRILQQVQGLDIAPTILDFADIPLSDSLEGKSLKPIFENGSDISTEVFFVRVPSWEYGTVRQGAAIL